MLKKIKRMFTSRSGDLPSEVEDFKAAEQESAPVEEPTPAAAPTEPAGDATESAPLDMEPGEFGPPMFRADASNPLVPDLIEAIKKVYDPEIPTDIFELGLIYTVEVDEEKAVDIKMTLTSPNCPSAVQIPADVETRVRDVEGVTACSVEVIWDPPWEKHMMSEAAMLELGMI